MPAISAATIAAVSRALMPLTADLYKAAKGAAQIGLARWQEKSFPKRLAKRIGGITLVKTLWSPDEDVELTSFYYAPKVFVTESRKRFSVTTVREMGSDNYVIQGIVGQGKSILLRHLAFQEALVENNPRLPVFIELRTLQKGYELRAAIYKTLSSYDIDINDEAFEHLCKSGKIVLFLDAFDELDESLIRSVLNDLDHLRMKFPEMQIVITSRPGNEIQKVPGLRVVKIMGLNPTDYAPFLTKLGLRKARIESIVKAIHESPSNLMNLITTPLMLTLVVIVYESEKEIPPTLSEFFEKLFQIVFSRHDRLKAGFNRALHSGLSERRLQSLFEAFCFMVMQNGFGRSLTNEQFSEAFDQAQEYMAECKCEQEKFRHDIVKVSCLMLEEGVDITTYLHKSIMEYYGAAFIKHSADDIAALFYQEALQNPKAWSEVIRFLSDIDGYQYSKEYAIPKIQKIRSDLIEPLRDKKVSSLIRVFTERFGGEESLTFYREKPDSGDYSLIGYGWYGAEDILYETLDQLVTQATFTAIPEVVTKEVLEQIVGMTLDDSASSREVEVPFHRVIEFAGPDEYWKAIGIFESWLYRKESEARSVVENQEKRRLIFKAMKK